MTPPPPEIIDKFFNGIGGINRPRPDIDFTDYEGKLTGNWNGAVRIPHTIYGIEFPDKAIYIGITKKTIKERFKQHKWTQKSKKPIKFIEEHGGIETAKLIYIDHAFSKTEALYKENWITAALKTYGFNAHGGVWWTYIVSHMKWETWDYLKFYKDEYTIVLPDYIFDDYCGNGLFEKPKNDPNMPEGIAKKLWVWYKFILEEPFPERIKQYLKEHRD